MLAGLLAASATAAPTWHPPFYLAPAGAAHSPQVAVNGDDDAVAVWRRFDGANWVVEAVSRVAGGPWGAPVALSSSAQPIEGLQVAIDEDGDAVVVWSRVTSESRRIVQAASRAEGKAWEVPVNLAGQNAREPQVALDAKGDAVAVWSRFDGANWIVQSASRPVGVSWSPRVDLSAAGRDAREPQVALDAKGDAVAVWSRFDGANTVIQSSHSAGSPVWSAPTTVTESGENAREPQVALDAKGDAVAAWSRFAGENSIVQVASQEGGAWGPTSDYASEGRDATTPQIAVDGSGDATLVWELGADSEAPAAVEVASRLGGGAWGEALSLSLPEEDAFAPQVAANPAGDVISTWEDGQHLIWAASKPGGGSWGEPEDLLATELPLGEDLAAMPQIGIDGDGNAVAIWARSHEAAALVQAAELAEAPVNLTPPAQTGLAAVGHKMNCSDGTWHGAPDPTFTYKWFGDGSEIPGATTNTYFTTLADASKQISCEVTASNAVGSAAAASNSIPMPAAGLFCAGIDITGRGTPLQGVAHAEVWGPVLPTLAVCPGGPSVAYQPSNDTAAMNEWNADGSQGYLETDVAFVGTDTGPTAAQVANVKGAAGPGVQLAVVPVAQTAVAVIANPPAGCTVEEVTNTDLTAVFEGRFTKWSQLGTAEGTCAGPITRVVPKDAQGVTTQLKNYLVQLNKKALPCVPGKASWQGLETANTSWPESCGEKTLSALVRPATDGGPEEVATVLATAGSVGFAVLPDAQSGGASTLRLQNNGQGPAFEATFAAPAAGASANCSAMTYKRPTGGGGLDLDWSGVFGAKPAIASGGYPLCMLTYVLALHGYEAAGFTVGQGSTVKDYVNGYVVTAAGQAAIANDGYAALPTSGQAQYDILGEARKAAGKITR